MIAWGHLRWFVVAVAGLVLVAGCQGSDGAQGRPSPVHPTAVGSMTSSATASATASPSADAAAWARIPQAARAHTFAGAQAFAEFYVAQINAAWTTPDPELLRPYSLPSCKSCANYVANAVEFRQAGHRYADPPISVVAGTWLPESTPSVAFASIVWRQRSTEIVTTSGKRVEAIPSGKGISDFELHWESKGWRVAAIRLEQPQ